VVSKRTIGKTIYPRPHDRQLQLLFSTVNSNQNSTIIPIIHHDEGLGDPNSYNANPMHSSFAESNSSNAYPDSEIRRIHARLDLSLTKQCYDTDKIEILRVMVMPIYISFLEDLTAADEKTGSTIEDILNLTHETTDRQTYPVYTGTDIYGDVTDLGTNTPGLTTDTDAEYVNFNPDQFWDAMTYYTNAGKLRKCIGKPKFFDVRKRSVSSLNMKISIKPKVKRMNEYTFCGLLIYLPEPATGRQLFNSSADSGVYHLQATLRERWLEWNENFDMTRQ
jgi:hypothetical protein